MTSKFYDLEISTLDDGTIRLEQRDYCGEAAIIDLHPAQVAYIADDMPVTAPERIQTQPQWAAERIATLERRLCWMRDRFEECGEALPHDMYERCAEASGFYSWLQASIDVATEFCADFPDASSNALASPLEAPLLPLGDGCLPSTAGSAGERPEQVNADLFSALEAAGA